MGRCSFPALCRDPAVVSRQEGRGLHNGEPVHTIEDTRVRAGVTERGCHDKPLEFSVVIESSLSL